MEKILEEKEKEQRKELIEKFIGDSAYKPMKAKEMAVFFAVPRQERESFRELLVELASEGKLTFSESGKIMRMEGSTRVGTFLATKRGFGFVRVEGEDSDIFIPADGCGDAFHEDTVLVQLWKGERKEGRSKEGRIIKILKRNTDTIVGTYSKSRNFGFVVADSEKLEKDVYISKHHDMGAVEGHKVVVRLTDYGTHDKNPEGEIIEILGHINDPGVDILSVVRGHGLREEFPVEVMQQLDCIPDEVTESSPSRMDLRDLPTVTIDGADAKDLDDAITLSKNSEGGYHLGVHIADVTNYVTEGSPLDEEAKKRGTSVYLTDRVIPMLPHKLSNGICSLNAGTDRLALSCLMDFDESGKLTSHKITESLIRVDERMNYSDVNDIITHHKPETCKRYEEFVPQFERMAELAAKLRKRRKKKGSIDFNFEECKIILDKDGTPLEIVPYERNVATRLIEEFMLAANQTVAEEYFWMEVPFLYRTHEEPDSEKIKELAVLTKGLGYHLRTGSDEVRPGDLQKLIEEIDGTDEEAFLSRLILRSMKRAGYTVDNAGHFGLAMQYYSHFTSPIRRYPDLQIHRIIKENLQGKLNDTRKAHYAKILPDVARIASEMERKADEAERETDKMKKAQYMRKHLGEVFEGCISGVTSWGIYVELPNTVEGMVRLTEIKEDKYVYDEKNYCVTGKYSGKSYRLGEKIKVVAAGVDEVAHTIDFELFSEEEN